MTMAFLLLGGLLIVVGQSQGIHAATWDKERPQNPFGVDTRIRSPNGQLELLWKEGPVKKDHQVWIRPVGNERAERLLYSFMRSADVLWSPDSKMVAITDAGGSNVSDVVVFRVYLDREPVELKDVDRHIRGFFGSESRNDLYSHSYSQTFRWSRDSRRLQVRLSAHHVAHPSRPPLKKLITVKLPPPED